MLHAAKSDEGVVANFGLSAWPSLLGPTRTRSFGPSLAVVSWAAQVAN